MILVTILVIMYICIAAVFIKLIYALQTSVFNKWTSGELTPDRLEVAIAYAMLVGACIIVFGCLYMAVIGLNIIFY